MTAQPIRVLLVEDEPAHAQLVQRYLAASADTRFQVQWLDRLAKGLEWLQENRTDAVLLDLGLPDSDPRSTLQRVLAAAPDTPVVVLTTSEDSAQAIEAVKSGAQDHLPKPRASADLLARSLRYAIERKRSERQLRQLNETLERRVAERSAVAEQRAQTLRRLASELSSAERRERRRLAQFLHDDLQQIIAAARMRLELLAADLHQRPEQATVRESIDLLEQAIQAARSLTLDLSPPILSVRGLGAALEWLGRRMEEQHGLKVQVLVKGDPRRLADDTASLLLDAARELLFNVIKHAQVDQAAVTLDCADPEAATLAVADQGAGVDPQTMPGPHAPAERFGLYSIRERLEAIGGGMDLRSQPGQGLTVILRAPYAPPEAQSDPAAAADRPKAPPPAALTAGRQGVIRVYLVDDHRIVREGLASAIANEPDLKLVGQAENGHAALAGLEQQAADVVVMDISMPGLSGIETTRRIKQAWPGVQVVSLSMHDPADLGASMRTAGAFTCLSKAGPIEALMQAVRQAGRLAQKTRNPQPQGS